MAQAQITSSNAASRNIASKDFPNSGRPTLDAHNCYPYDGQWANRIDRALALGFPVSIEQDLAWYRDPSTQEGRVVVTHSATTNGTEPTLKNYFFERVRPIVEKALKDNNRANWPLIILHFDFKDNQPALLRAVWKLLGEYEPWLTTAVKTDDPRRIEPFQPGPILAVTEDSDAQQQVFFDELPVGSKLRVFGSAHTNLPRKGSQAEVEHLAATLPANRLLTEPASNYRRWWNNSWHQVEEGGQTKAGEWNPQKMERLRALVNRAHELGYWIRFYTLDGFSADANRGWSEGYNFGSMEAVRVRWEAAIEAGVDMIATDQYEDLAALVPLKK
ncbi:MAG: hypothetical protein JO307_24545 [Bryobacterales bacterium]|nr:hypothetical protein [Bryobacterales bacterium]MBV9396823.1 hypothetical protein [Bryobacterales bacterium]